MHIFYCSFISNNFKCQITVFIHHWWTWIEIALQLQWSLGDAWMTERIWLKLVPSCRLFRIKCSICQCYKLLLFEWSAPWLPDHLHLLHSNSTWEPHVQLKHPGKEGRGCSLTQQCSFQKAWRRHVNVLFMRFLLSCSFKYMTMIGSPSISILRNYWIEHKIICRV